MSDLRYRELFKALFIAFAVAYFCVWLTGMVFPRIIALLTGPLFLFVGGWLFYKPKEKIVILKEVIREEASGAFSSFYNKNFYKRELSILLNSLFIILFWGVVSVVFSNWWEALASLTIFFVFFILLFFNSEIPFYGDTDKDLDGVVLSALLIVFWEIPKTIFWTIPKSILKIVIISFFKIHSKELLAVSIYALTGMLYIIFFPPFDMAIEMVFLMSIPGGIFTGLCGCLIHRSLSAIKAQQFYALVKAW